MEEIALSKMIELYATLMLYTYMAVLAGTCIDCLALSICAPLL